MRPSAVSRTRLSGSGRSSEITSIDSIRSAIALGDRVGHQRRRQPVGDLPLQRLAAHVFQQLDVAHRHVVAAVAGRPSRSRCTARVLGKVTSTCAAVSETMAVRVWNM